MLLESLDMPSRAVTEATRVRGIEPDDVIPSAAGSFRSERALRELADRTDDSGPTWLRHSCRPSGRTSPTR